jgi:hypothetical protein
MKTNLATSVLLLGLLVIKDTERGGEDDIAELTRGQQVVGPLLDVTDGNVKSRGDDGALVQATEKVDNDLSRAVVVDDLELADVTVSLHDLEELNDDLGAGSDENLTLSSLLSVGENLESAGKGINKHHSAARKVEVSINHRIQQKEKKEASFDQ